MSFDQVSATQTLLRCFEELARTMPRAPQLEAIMPENFTGSSVELCMLLAEKFNLRPELRSECSLDELSSHFGSPVFLRLKNDNWIFFVGVRRMQKNNVSIERFAVWDPLGKGKQQMIMLQREQLEKAWSGNAVFIHQEMTDCSVDGRHTALFALGAIVRQNRCHFEIGRILHDYAISEDEPKVRLLSKIADELGFRNKKL